MPSTVFVNRNETDPSQWHSSECLFIGFIYFVSTTWTASEKKNQLGQNNWLINRFSGHSSSNAVHYTVTVGKQSSSLSSRFLLFLLYIYHWILGECNSKPLEVARMAFVKRPQDVYFVPCIIFYVWIIAHCIINVNVEHKTLIKFCVCWFFTIEAHKCRKLLWCGSKPTEVKEKKRKEKLGRKCDVQTTYRYFRRFFHAAVPESPINRTALR